MSVTCRESTAQVNLDALHTTSDAILPRLPESFRLDGMLESDLRLRGVCRVTAAGEASGDDGCRAKLGRGRRTLSEVHVVWLPSEGAALFFRRNDARPSTGGIRY